MLKRLFNPSRTTRLICVLGAIAFMLSACASLGGLEKSLRVSLIDLQAVEFQLLEQRYLATIRIQNPNPVALPIHGLDYTIRINDSEFADGVSNQRVTIPAFGEKTLHLGVNSTIIKLLEQIRRFGETKGTVKYVISGTLAIEGIPVGVDFERGGEIDLRLERRATKHAA